MRAAITIFLLFLAVTAHAGIVYTNVFSFNGTNGAGPEESLLQDVDGSFFGATRGGGTSGNGTIFRMAPDGALFTLVSFTGTNGAYLGTGPGQLVKGNDGFFYGVTFMGGIPDGTNTYGTVFRVSSNGAFATLFSFTGTNPPYLGANPGHLILAADGNLYGTTLAGGSADLFTQGLPYPFYSYGYGTIFKLSTNGVFETLALFTGTNGPFPGRQPAGGLLQAKDGYLYGTTQDGGTNVGDFGTVYKIDTSGVLAWSFTFMNTNGACPQGGLVQGTNGVLYGATTYYGSLPSHFGSILGSTIFKITTNGTLTTLIKLTGSSPVPNPNGGLIQGSDGNLYGTTDQGGSATVGSVFRMTPSGAGSNLYVFSGGTNSGANPRGSLLQASDSNFYGTATSGGAFGGGVIYRLSVPLRPVFSQPTPFQSNGDFVLNWSAVASQTYQLQYIRNLNSTNWANVGTPITATNGAVTTSDPSPIDPQRFYRVMELP